MKAIVIMNNYQLGSYPHQALSQMIVKETRIDKGHTKVEYDNLTKSDIDLLKRLFKKVEVE